MASKNAERRGASRMLASIAKLRGSGNAVKCDSSFFCSLSVRIFAYYVFIMEEERCANAVFEHSLRCYSVSIVIIRYFSMLSAQCKSRENPVQAVEVPWQHRLSPTRTLEERHRALCELCGNALVAMRILWHIRLHEKYNSSCDLDIKMEMGLSVTGAFYSLSVRICSYMYLSWNA